MKLQRFRPLTIAAAAAIGLAGALVQAPAASGLGESSVTITGPTSALVGVPLTMGVLVDDSWTPGTSLTITPVGSNAGAAAPITVPNVSGQQQVFKFVPPHVGTYTFSVNGVTVVNAPSVQVQPVSVNINVKAPNTVRAGQAVTINATVTPTQGVLSPIGQIQFAIVGSGNLGQPVWLNQGSPSTASISWTPGAVGSVQFTATYIPFTINGFPDTTCANSNCTSAVDTVQVTNTGVNVFLTNPPQFFAGVPNIITAQVSVVPPTGGVTFLVNGQAFASNVPVQANGQASASWTPPAPGNYTISANWKSDTGVTGGSQETVTVSAGTGATDSIVLTPAGQASWAVGGTYQVPNGTTLTFAAATSSGSAVTLTDRGPCTISGMSLTATQGSGACTLIASSPGGRGFAPGTTTYNIQLVPGVQVADVNPPASGRYKVGRVLVLESPGQADTNAGQNIGWTIQKKGAGRKHCKLLYPNNGSVTLRVTGKGSCTVVGRAPGVAGQWQPFRLTRTYRGT